MTLPSSELHITLERLSAPSEGLSTLVSNHECREKKKNSSEIRKAGTGRRFAHNASQLLRFTAADCLTSTRERYKPMPAFFGFFFSSRVPGVQVNRRAKRSGGGVPLPVSLASLAASKADSAGCVIDWLLQLCPSYDLQTSYFLSRRITSLSLSAVWKVWTRPRWTGERL